MPSQFNPSQELKRPRGFSRLLFAAFVLLASVATLRAQETTGTILGTVTDTSGAVVLDAQVTIVDIDRNSVERTVKTNRTGGFSAPLLPIGHYTVKVEAPGFKTYSESNLTLNLSDNLNLKPVLQVGSVAETVSVQANTLQVDTQSATAQNLITGVQIRELALASRNYEQLVALMPGVTSDVSDTLYAGVSAPSGNTNEVAYSLNGSQGTQNNWTVDGADNVDRGGNFTLLNYPSVDAIEEFRVLRGNYNAEYGRSSGGQVNVVTRSGTSKFHGGVYEFFRNNVLDANEWLNKHSQPIIPRTPFRYNDFGGTFGGPIFIPHHYNVDKSKTFFFFSEEVRRIVQSSSVQSQAPNLQERGLDPATGNVPTFAYSVCLVPTSGDGSCPAGQSSTVIPTTLINPAAAAYLKDVYSHVPIPQDPVGDVLNANQSNVFNYRQEIFRLDQTFNSKWSGFLRIINDTIPSVEGGGLFNGNAIPNITQTNTLSPGKNIVASVTTIFSPTLLNQLEYAWSYGAVLSTNTGQLSATNSPNVAQAIMLPNPETLNRIPSISFGSSSASFFGFGDYKDYNKNHNIFDNLTKTVGRHTMKFGVSYHHYQKSENSGGNNAGTFTFQVSPDTTLSSGADPNAEFHQEFADFLTGQSTSFTQLQRDIRAVIDQNEIEMYGQDDYRVRPNLTVSYGLRYSMFRQPTDANNQATSFDPSRFNPAHVPVLDDQGLLCTPQTMPCSGTSNTNPDYDPLNGVIIGGRNSPYGTKVASESNNGFGPRIGMAWDPTGTGKLSIRSGYGVFVESPGVGFIENNLFSNPPFVGTTTIQNAPFDNPGAGQSAPNNAPTPLGATKPKFRQPYVQQWNLDVQRELPWNIIADVGYYGAKGTHLLSVVDINQPVPGAYTSLGLSPGSINSSNETLINSLRPFVGYAGIDQYAPIFMSNYNSLQTNVQKNFRSGSLVALNYTWSKSLTNVPDDPNFSAPQDSRNLESEYSYSRFDQRNVFTANFVYQLPFYKEQHGFVGHLLGGYEFSGIISANSGHWLNPLITDGNDPGGVGLGTGIFGSIVRPNVVGNPNRRAPHSAAQWFNKAAFAPADPGQTIPGTARRNSILGPGRSNVDISLLKNIRVTEGSAFQFRLEAFNALNHTSYSSIDTTQNNTTFGNVTGAHQARIVQLGAKFNF
jgi:hypothetical protein